MDQIIKAFAREAYVEGYKKGYHVETYSDFDIRVANMCFDRWWEANYE